MTKPAEVRIILIGKTGNGKSSTGNSLLRKEAFKHKTSPNAVTEECEKKFGTNVENTVRYTIVDTPGLLDTAKPLGERALDILRSVEICNAPHAFLLVFSATNRMTQDEIFTIDMLRIMFGELVFQHSIVVFTHGQTFETDIEFKLHWTANENFVNLIKLCGDRVAKIENRKDFDVYGSNKDAEHILRMVRDVSDGGKRVYNYRHLAVHKRIIQKHAEKYDGKSDIHTEVAEIVKKLGDSLDDKTWNKKLFLGIAIGASAIGGLGAGYMSITAANAVAASGLGASMMGGASAVGGAIIRSAGGVGTAVLSNGAAVGGAVLRTAWGAASRVRLW